jgi:VCBS repeat-containing protein
MMAQATTTDQRRAALAMAQLLESFGARRLDHDGKYLFAVDDEQHWANVLTLALGARRYLTMSSRGRAADAIEISFGGVSVHVQGPVREATLNDYRRWREQREQEGE